ncbi:DUF2071 domain-containing protein [Oceanobacillus halotolerans]|uniref:DUF2071 domain-containing protein n=1 Tax=Oceanobacillus halotolerans TaxID=2663380 RepID=UPI0013DD2E57|nr:DUF2071 domain-containing protein [Oceanobacillus halotolerans]
MWKPLFQNPIASQQWKNMCFLHWPVPYDIIRPQVPSPFKLETYNGYAWVTIVFFCVQHTKLRGMSKKLHYPPFLQMNIRTYIQFYEEPSVYFLSIKTDRKLAAWFVRTFFRFPIYPASIHQQQLTNKHFYEIKREAKPSCHLALGFYPTDDTFDAADRPLSKWLMERYAFYFRSEKKIVKGRVRHEPWRMQTANAEVGPSDITTAPIAFTVPNKQAYLYPLQTIGLFSDG